MKASSKLDQLRAMREGQYAPRIVRAKADQPSAAFVKINEGLQEALVIARDAAKRVPWLAPEGQCASCDKRRAALQKTMKRRRAKPSEC